MLKCIIAITALNKSGVEKEVDATKYNFMYGLLCTKLFALFLDMLVCVTMCSEAHQYEYRQIAKYVQDKNVIDIVKDCTNHHREVSNILFMHWTSVPRDSDLRHVLTLPLAQTYVYHNGHTNFQGLKG